MLKIKMSFQNVISNPFNPLDFSPGALEKQMGALHPTPPRAVILSHLAELSRPFLFLLFGYFGLLSMNNIILFNESSNSSIVKRPYWAHSTQEQP